MPSDNPLHRQIARVDHRSSTESSSLDAVTIPARQEDLACIIDGLNTTIVATIPAQIASSRLLFSLSSCAKAQRKRD